MKPIALVPPAAALIIGGIWLGVRQHSIAQLDQQSLLLEASIANARAAAQSNETASTSSPGTSSGSERKAIDWKKFAAQLATLSKRDGIGDQRAIMKLREQIEAMSEQDLLAALDEIATLDLSRESLLVLEDLLASQLAPKAPETFLTRFLNRLEDQESGMSWHLPNALSTWARKDPLAAIAWFDRQIAAGAFDSESLDGKSESRFLFEGALVRELLSSTPEAAASRIAGFPPEQRKEALRYARLSSLVEAAPAFADLVRKQLPAEDQAKALAEAAPVIRGGDYSKVTDYLNRIAATPAEREACVEEAGQRAIERLGREREIKQEDFDHMREWIAKEAPTMTDRTTGMTLASLLSGSGRIKFTQAADLAIHYHEGGGGDELLLPLLEQREAKRNPDVARKLAERITDEKKREEILRKLK